MTWRQIQIRVNAENYFGSYGYYPHFRRPKGLAVIINNYKFGGSRDRVGSEADAFRTMALFETLGYDLETHFDLTAQGMLDTMINVEENFNLEYQSCVVVLMTHGSLGHFEGIDGVLIRESDFVKPLSLSMKMREIPKLFFFQACRDGPFKNTTPAGYETFIFHSTSLTFKSVRAPFIKAICEIIGRDAHESWAEISRLFPSIISDVQDKTFGVLAPNSAQTPIGSTFNTTFWFHFFPVEDVFGS